MEKKIKKIRATRQAKVPKTPSSTKKKRVLKPKVEKTRNSGTMTESAFFNWLRQILRKASMYWRPIAEVKKAAQVPYHGINPRRKYSYKCSDCNKEVAGKDCNIHHLKSVGTLTSFEDLPQFVENLFCEKEGLICICSSCHDKRHNK